MKTKEWLLKKRAEYGLTQKMLADAINISKYTIENIEQGKRLGSVDTWEKIEDYFFKMNYKKGKDPEIRVSMDSEKIIVELKEDIEEFGEDEKCILVYKVINNTIIFTNYDFITEYDPEFPNEIPWSEEELNEDEKYIETTLKYALEVFEAQDKLF